MDFLYEDKYLVVANKFGGTPALPDKSGDRSLMEMIQNALKLTLYPINRLDRPTSGIVLYAKSRKAAANFSKQWQSKKQSKVYLAAVRNAPAEDKAVLKHFLNKKHSKAYIASEAAKGKKAILDYERIGQTKHYSILQIKLHTGRFHQIRAQLAHIGSPIKGDVKYGDKRANKDRAIHLHAWKMSFLHPYTQEEINIEAPLPDDPVWNHFEKI